MRSSLDSGDRKLLIFSGVLLLLMTAAGALLGPAPTVPGMGLPSSYSTGEGGAKAAYLLLEELGYDVERWEQSPAELPSEADRCTLILADPLIPPSADEKNGLRAFVAAGGRLLVTGSLGATMLPEADPKAEGKPSFAAKAFRAQLPGPLSVHAPEVTLRAPVRWGTRHAHHLRYYGDEAGAVVVRYRFGRGEMIWWADALPLTNGALTETSNFMLYLNSVGDPDRLILWDEYFHGQRPGLWSYLGRTSLPWAGLQLGLLAATLLFTYARRLGPVRPLTVEGLRLSPLEFVETVGELYERKRAAAGALEVIVQRYRFLLLRRMSLPVNARLEEVASMVRAQQGPDAARFVETLHEAEQSAVNRRLAESDALRLVGDLHEGARRLGLGGKLTGD